MTERLRTLMHDKAEQADFPMPDVDALVAAGRRRNRRQGLLAGGVALVLAAGTAVGVGALVRGDDPSLVAEQPPAAAGPFPRGPLTWASGSVIHYGTQDVEVSHRVQAFVQTTNGFVVASDGDVYVVDTSGATKVGQVDRTDPRLVSDEDATYAAWVQAGSSSPTVAVVDTSDLTTSAEPADGAAKLYALDDGQVYWRDARGVVAVDVAGGSVDVLEADPADGFELYDVEKGVLAFSDDENGGLRIGNNLTEAPTVPGQQYVGRLSPDARHYAPDDETLSVLTTDGGNVSPTVSGYFFSTAFGWLDDDTVAVTALDTEDGATFSLLTCSIGSGTCTDAVADTGPMDSFALPVGIDFTGS